MTDVSFLPDSRLTALVMGSGGDIYSYAQTMRGHIFELKGKVQSQAFSAAVTKSHIIIERVKGQTVLPNAPKLFSPFAATAFTNCTKDRKDIRYVFYLDDNNILHDQYFTADGYEHGTLSSLGVKVAHYSGLAAVTIQNSAYNNAYNFMCVYYQSPDANAAVKMVSYSGFKELWEHGAADLRDPPLFGTSITAVPPREGILGHANPKKNNDGVKGQPIYYLQLDNKSIGSGQGVSEPLALAGYNDEGEPLVFSPHTSLTAVDNGTQLHLVYKSHRGTVKMIRIVDDSPSIPATFFSDLNVAPRSAIAAVLAPTAGDQTSIVLFYQSLDPTTRKTKLAARVVTKPTAAVNEWTVSDPEVVGD